MAGQKSTSPLPARKHRATASKSKPAAKPFRSTEFVEYSDDSGGAGTKALKKKVPKTIISAPATTKHVPPQAKEPTTNPPKKRKSPSPNPAKAKSSRSGSEEDDSESESEASSSSQDASPIPTRPKSTATQLAQSKISPKPSVEKVPMIKTKLNESSSTRKSSSQSEGEGDSESSETGSESDSGSSDQNSLHSARKRSPIRKPTSKQASGPYEPPPGFEAPSISVHPSSKAAEIFSPAYLAGKEIWHITAPASVPIASIKEVSMQGIKARTSILSHKGADYSLVPESGAEQANNQALLLPSIQTNSYQTSTSTIIKTLHLQQLVNLPNHTTSPAKPSNQTATVPEPQKNAPRQQPQGLRMRYHPFGASDESETELSPANVAKAPEFRDPNTVEAPQAKKRKSSEMDSVGQSADVSPAKAKSKKRKTQGEAVVNGADTAMDDDAVEIQGLEESGLKDKTPEASNGPISDAHGPNGTQPEKAEVKRKKEKQKHSQPEQLSAPVSALPSQIAKEAETIMPEEVVDGASAIDIAASENKKTKRREERRKRKEAAKAAEQQSQDETMGKQDAIIADAEPRAKQDEVIQTANSQSREESVHLPTPKHSSAQKVQRIANGGSGSIHESSQTSSKQETKEERARRKEEKPRKRIAMGSG
ncbi:hypothetical protein OEA41_004633 [Lepraria neglecta]|uniref:Uncharacterized protein n=1 Tax=Lepraria neglecta TaxID=209136 RepID=A0AAD9Z1E1_9LECA|nr:hypothetical protein OEA41_004633 [Lepraria neglecta]